MGFWWVVGGLWSVVGWLLVDPCVLWVFCKVLAVLLVFAGFMWFCGRLRWVLLSCLVVFGWRLVGLGWMSVFCVGCCKGVGGFG